MSPLVSACRPAADSRPIAADATRPGIVRGWSTPHGGCSTSDWTRVMPASAVHTLVTPTALWLPLGPQSWPG